jgi:hypothetical protein
LPVSKALLKSPGNKKIRLASIQIIFTIVFLSLKIWEKNCAPYSSFENFIRRCWNKRILKFK